MKFYKINAILSDNNLKVIYNTFFSCTIYIYIYEFFYYIAISLSFLFFYFFVETNINGNVWILKIERKKAERNWSWSKLVICHYFKRNLFLITRIQEITWKDPNFRWYHSVHGERRVFVSGDDCFPAIVQPSKPKNCKCSKRVKYFGKQELYIFKIILNYF